ncbi:glycosyl transferase family 36 [Paenibacillus sp. TRM 82003]|nr:glycosyl transferase family 36 [Paenibacillus sp. TRM 82003]
MSLHDEKMRQESHKLALQHDPFMKRTSSRRLWAGLEADIGQLRVFVKELHEDRSACAQPAEEWLLDHAEFIEGEVLSLREELSERLVRKLPSLSKSDEPRVFAIALDYLEHTDGALHEDSFIEYIRSYQEVSVLTLAEAWAIPLLLKAAVIRKLAGIMETIRERRSICGLVDGVLAGMKPSELTPERLRVALEEAGQEMPLSGATIVHLIQHLREVADDTANVGEWLMCKLENGPESLDSILSYEFQLQAAYQVTTGNLMGTLRKLSRWSWRELFGRVCLVERTLEGELAGDYPRLDDASRDTLRGRVETLARRMRVPENLVATEALKLANRAFEALGDRMPAPDGAPPPRDVYVAYYLLEPDGLSALREALKACGRTGALPEAAIKRRATGAYFQLLGASFAVLLIAFAAWLGSGAPDRAWGWWAVGFVLLAFPISEFAVAFTHWVIERVKKPTRLLRYDFSRGVPEEATTMVVIPVIWSTTDEVKELTDRLELHALANRDPNVRFAILSDFKDGDQAELPEDRSVLEAAKTEIERLNREYPETSFHLFHRKRMWNDSEKTWMGWERKRGKLVEFVELLRGSASTSYSVVEGDRTVLERVRYVITLDADTQLPLESAHRMIGAIHLPFNRPRLNKRGTRVAEGYGVLQPRIGMTHESALRSRLTSLWASDPGIDPYAFAVSDPYQDAMGQGVFTGKGIFDVAAFEAVLCDRIPENRVLSHDLLEGGFLRAGLLSDIELVDDHPATFRAHQKRLHRWVRGDWQLLPWLTSRVPDRHGRPKDVDLSVLTRWQIFDNLRRSLLHPALLAILLFAAPLLPGPALGWYAVVVATLLLPFFRQLTSLHTLLYRRRNLGVALGQAAVAFLTLPYQTVMLLDAIGKTLYRLFVSKRGLLVWVSQAEVDRSSRKGGAPAVVGLIGGAALAAIFALSALWSGVLAVQAVGVLFAAFWFAAPAIVRWLDRPLPQETVEFTASETEELKTLAHEIWSFYEHYVTEEDSWLPPDNVQMEPANGVAHRTSPTNIGLYMSCALAARDFGFIDTPGLVDRLERTVETIERMEKWEGHLYNWYDTVSLAPLHPVYVSTVDSGNFVACLMAVREGLAEWLRADGIGDERGAGGERSRRREDEFQVAFAEEIGPERRGRSARPSVGGGRGARLAARIDALVQGTNFRPLYDHKANLFALGYHVTRQERDTVLYDLMASEARQASFVAIALGQVSVAHWNALGRTMAKVGKRPALLSWSGTMFEYLMPWLFMRTYKNTIWDQTYRAVVDRQIEYARQRDVPFGISESGFFAFDYQMNYQYRAFGVPGLGFKRGLEEDLVLAPYATIMALPYAGRRSLQALERMASLGGRGKYGYYEAMDFTPKRLPAGKRHMVVRSFMAHHQGMSMLTISNLLLKRTMVSRFHRNKAVRASELLLQERLPTKPAIVKHPALLRSHEPTDREPYDPAEVREFTSPHTAIPESNVLSNGRFTTVVTNSGSGFSRYEGIAVTRWREDPVRDPWGSYVYVRDVECDRLWSPSYQPCRVDASEQRVSFELERATFSRKDGDIRTVMEICVSPEAPAEVRRISLMNEGDEPKVVEVTTFVELSLASPIADEAHPAFNKLFVRTDYDEEAECLVAGRRAREVKDKVVWAAHALFASGGSLGPAEFETDRGAFVGRGSGLADPAAIRGRLSGKTGSVADPAFVMRRRVRLEPGKPVHLFAVTSAADTREDAIAAVARLANEPESERTFQMAWNRTRIELRHLNLTHREAVGFQRFASQVLYTAPLRRERERRIRANTKGQSGLWSFGVSGDRPLVLAHIDNRSQISFVVKLLTGHEYLRRLGLPFDLVLLNESSGGYYQDLQEALQRAVEHGVDRFGAGVSGVHVLPAARLNEDDLTLLLAVARVSLRAGGPSLTAQLRLSRRAEPVDAPKALEPAPGKLPLVDRLHEGGAGTEPFNTKDGLLFWNGWGGFTPDGKAYRMAIKHGHALPAPWINVVANKEFGFLVSEMGTGYTWWRNSRECKLTPWSNDPVLDPPTEIGFLRDEDSGTYWSLTPSAGVAAPPYQVTHGRGYSRFEHARAGIQHAMTLFAPTDEPVKIMRIRVKNKTSATRRLSLTYYAEWVLGVQRPANAPFVVTDWNDAAKLLVARNTYQETFREATAFLGIYPQGVAGKGDELSWTGDQFEFVGRNRVQERPAALGRERLSCRTGAFHASCGAVQQKLSLASGEEREIIVLLGCDASEEEAALLAEKYGKSAACDEAMKDVEAFWDRTLGQTVVQTPSVEMNLMLNGWLLYQSLACRMWARTAFYQAGGAFGFRDQLQDALAMLHTMPELTRKQILIHAAHQYVEGDVQHWWHEETERGIRTLFSDDLLWLPYVTSRYIEHTGDDTVLEETAPFLTSEPLKEGEHERYEETVRSPEIGTVYEHGVRAIDKALSRIGEHGLPLIGVGDWNDGMNLVGPDGRGESVWLGWFLGESLRRFAPIAQARGETERAASYLAARERLEAALHEHGWDGQWYRRAFTDAGTWLGTIHNRECRIDAIAQSWSVISGMAPKDRALQAMQSFDRELVDRDLAVVRLLTPPFDETEPSPGYIQGYPPGIRENGAQYTHGVLWSIMAWSQLGEGDKAFELFHMLNPITHTRTDHEVRQYVGEPYVMAADVYTANPHQGHAGWTWYTGASGWMYQVGLEWILGLRRQAERLYVDPRLPGEWPGYSATYRNGATTYEIQVGRAADGEEPRMLVDGAAASPDDTGLPYATLLDDGAAHRIELTI